MMAHDRRSQMSLPRKPDLAAVEIVDQESEGLVPLILLAAPNVAGYQKLATARLAQCVIAPPLKCALEDTAQCDA